MAKVLVTYYSTYGHTYTMAEAVAKGAAGQDGDNEVRLRRIPELEAARQAMSGDENYVEFQRVAGGRSRRSPTTTCGGPTALSGAPRPVTAT